MKNNMKKFLTIKCPKCGREYLLEEIYSPYGLFGRPKNIVKDTDGKIISFEGDTIDTEETFTCEKCECTFDVELRITADTKVNVEQDFSEDYSVPIYKERLLLDEGQINLWQ